MAKVEIEMMTNELNMEPIYRAVLESYHRCEESGDFFDSFYEIFLTKSPEIPPKFAGTDMQRQKQMVAASTMWMLRLGRGDLVAWQGIEEIGVSHSRKGHNIPPRLYSVWLDALCQAVARHDPQYDEQLDAQWRTIMEEGIDLIVSKY